MEYGRRLESEGKRAGVNHILLLYVRLELESIKWRDDRDGDKVLVKNMQSLMLYGDMLYMHSGRTMCFF